MDESKSKIGMWNKRWSLAALLMNRRRRTNKIEKDAFTSVSSPLLSPPFSLSFLKAARTLPNGRVGDLYTSKPQVALAGYA
jgi:hypothetical protein